MAHFHTLSHELGHTLGLCHTYRGFRVGPTCPSNLCDQERVSRPDDCQGSCDQLNCDSQECVPNCNISGDYVCDTPPDLGNCETFNINDGILSYSTWTDYCGEPYVSNNIILSNVMSFWGGSRYLTEGQACKAYTTILEFHQDKIKEVALPVQVIDEDFIVNGDITLSTDHVFNSDIIIKPGASLTFNGIRAEFSSTSEIRIETLEFGIGYTFTKSTLTIIDSQLAPICEAYTWGGIDSDEGSDISITNSQVISADDIKVTSANFIVSQDNIPGQYFITESLFENSPLSFNYIDGIVDINNSTFVTSRSTFSAQVRVFGDNMPFDAFISDCDFIIKQINILPSSNALIIEDTQFVSLNNTFSNFYRAIRAFPVLKAPKASLINGCTFSDNVTSIEASTFTGLKIRQNLFEIGQAHESYTLDHLGVSLNFCIDYDIKDNVFESGTDGVRRFGLAVGNSGPDFELISSNSFSQLNEAISTFGENRDVINNGITGLEFQCNNLSAISETDFVIGGEGIQNQQGDEDNGAGNNFSYSNPSDNSSSIKMLNSNTIQYYRNPNEQLGSNNPLYTNPAGVDILNSIQSASCFNPNFQSNIRKNKQSLGSLIENYSSLRSRLGNDDITFEELSKSLRKLNFGIKSMINDPNKSFSNIEMSMYWTQYKTSLIAQRIAYIEKMSSGPESLANTIDDIKMLSAQRYSDTLNIDSLIKIIKSRLSSTNDFEAELYKNLLSSLEYQSS